MPVSVVVNATADRSGEAATTLRDLLKPLASKVRGIDIERIRRGKRSVPVPKALECSLGKDEQPDAFVNDLIDYVLEVCRDEADGIKTKFRVLVLGDALAVKRPTLGEATITIEEEEEERSTRESETVGMLREAKDILKGVGEAYRELVKVLPGALRSNTELSRELGSALASAQGARWEWEYKTEELAANKVLEGLRLEANLKKTERRWTSIDALFAQLAPYLEIAAQIYAQSGVDPGGPTPEEIDTVFGKADPEFARLAKEFLKAQGGSADNIKVELKKRWQGLPDSAKAVVLQAVGNLDKARVVTLGLWMKRNGLT